jgi:hypothetical protein
MAETTSGDKLISKVQIFSSAMVIGGLVTRIAGQRLLDLLNTGPEAGARYADFICLYNASIGGNLRPNPEQPIFVNKTNIFFVTEEEGQPWQRKASTMYPFVSKEVIGIKFYVPSYTLTGKIHYLKGHKPQDVLTSHAKFFPLTEAHIYSSAGLNESPASFIAVNKDQVLYVESIY